MNLGSYTEFAKDEPYRKVTWTKQFALLPRYATSDNPDTLTLWLKRIYRCRVITNHSGLRWGRTYDYYYTLEEGLIEMLKGTHQNDE